MANIIKTLVDRYKKAKKFDKDTYNEAQKIFKKTIAGGKRYHEPEFGFSKNNKEFRRIWNTVKKVRKSQDK